MKISNLLERDWKLVEKKKIFFLIPVAIVLIAAIFMLVRGLVTGSPVNLGTDFTGGYAIDIGLGTKLSTEAATSDYENRVKEVIKNLKSDEGTSYNIEIKNIQKTGVGSDSALRVMYDAKYSEQEMVDINAKLKKELIESLSRIVPVSDGVKDGTLTLTYQFSFADIKTPDGETQPNKDFIETKAKLENALKTENVTFSSIERSENARSLIVSGCSAVSESALANIKNAVTIADNSFGTISDGNLTTAAFSSELLWGAFAAILASVVLMLVYIAFRFELTSGISAIIALFHDIIIMFCFMAIFNIEINSTFVAALITILGYSINNTIIIFDRVRENRKTMFDKGFSASYIANKSVSETLVRSINTTLTTLLTIGMVAILGVRDIKIFALPIIIGLLAGTYSSICISPAIWATWKDRKKKGAKASENKKLQEAVTPQQ